MSKEPDLLLPLTSYYGYHLDDEPAWIVDVAPHLAPYGFAVHRALPLQFEFPLTAEAWAVSNIETGAALFSAANKDLAIAKAREFLADNTLEQIARAIDKIDHKFGARLWHR